MESYTLTGVVSLVLLVMSCLGVLLWVFRPHSKEIYDEVSQIPLKDSEDEESELGEQK
jgi:cbb3-type cytochrome oxidase subunit 3